MGTIDFDTWFDQLKKLAKENDLEWLISDQEDYRASFKNGIAPEEELKEQISEAKASF